MARKHRGPKNRFQDINYKDQCRQCHPKVAYPSKKTAAAAAARVRRERGHVVQHYKCSAGKWHIGHPIDGQVWRKTQARMGLTD